MQRATFQQATLIHRHARTLPGRGTDLEEQAAYDDSFQEETSMPMLVLSVLANVIGGTLLLSGMFVMPHIIARILG